jgi:uncharacterized protein (TIGR00369 family)
MIKTLNPDFQTTVREKLLGQSFLNYIGFEITNIAEGAITGQLILREAHYQHKGIVHGGLTATIADIVCGFAATSLVAQDHQVVTVELKVAYLNPGMGTRLQARGWVLKQGRQLNFCEAEVYCIKDNDEPILIAKASATMATIPAGPVEKQDDAT